MKYRGYTIAITRRSRGYDAVAHCKAMIWGCNGIAGKHAAEAKAKKAVDDMLAEDAAKLWEDMGIAGVVTKDG